MVDKNLLLSILCTFVCMGVLVAQTENALYDANLAEALGADDYGMRSYTFVILKTGDTVIEDKSVVDSLFRGHMNSIHTLAESGKLIIAGPFGKNDLAYRGLYFFDLAEGDRIEDLLQQDPAIKAGLLKPIVLPWYGAAALPTYLETQEKVTKMKF